ncbi:unnamed protein product [Bemisia tabaci]|uniref:Alpha-carbonic anhydrase domain-containing protein n=1 Tax=Bemisia tabaci TaxID=7038 RepID=A0A9P0AMT6_BEMTA|nr:unnamed protein product [Bemisia tabaci]
MNPFPLKQYALRKVISSSRTAETTPELETVRFEATTKRKYFAKTTSSNFGMRQLFHNCIRALIHNASVARRFGRHAKLMERKFWLEPRISESSVLPQHQQKDHLKRFQTSKGLITYSKKINKFQLCEIYLSLMKFHFPSLLEFCSASRRKVLTPISILLGKGLTADDGRKATTKEFGYEANEDEIPPNSWSEQYGTCSGKYQSPIDIEESLVTRVYLPPLEFTNFNEVPSSAMITNNGHTVMLKYNFSSPASIKGGPLQKEYFFEQMHFHWGTNDSIGSEDLINNHSFPMELHMVFYNSDYGNIDNASNYKDGLVVLATFFEPTVTLLFAPFTERNNKGPEEEAQIFEYERFTTVSKISPFENDVYQTLIKALPDVTEADKKEYLENVPVLASLLPCNPERYFSYLGSLTTPPCLEVVTWIDFKHPVLLSHTQVHTFRTLHSHHGMLTHNFRPVQPLSNRPVWYNAHTFVDSGASTLFRIDAIACLIGMLGLIKLMSV